MPTYPLAHKILILSVLFVLKTKSWLSVVPIKLIVGLVPAFHSNDQNQSEPRFTKFQLEILNVLPRRLNVCESVPPLHPEGRLSV